MTKLFRGAAALFLAIGPAGLALAGTDEPVAPPPGAVLVLGAAASGVQIYECRATPTGFGWVFEAPEATLVDAAGQVVATHFAGPTWKARDGSAVVGEVVAKADAPERGAVPWLLLRAKSHDGSGTFSAVAYIRRADTKGGAAPAVGCDAAHAAQQVRVPYSATYQFFRAAG